MKLNLGYTREIKHPKNRTEGLENQIQMIINALEAGQNREALLLAVDLLDDINNTLDDITGVRKRELEKYYSEEPKLTAEEAENHRKLGFQEGVISEKLRIIELLGLKQQSVIQKDEVMA